MTCRLEIRSAQLGGADPSGLVEPPRGRTRSGRCCTPADRIVFREYLCPVTGYRIDTEIAKTGQPPLHDIVVHV
jgi:hypothetical protein